MSKSKKEINPQVNKGDRIMCLHMDGETSVPMGTTGTVRSVVRDPFEVDELIINVDWDNGNKLGLLSTTDTWVKISQEKLEESKSDYTSFNFFSENPEIFENFDWRFLRDFLYKLRESSVVNMYQAEPFLYSGEDWIERYYGEGKEEDENFQELLSVADEAKDKMVQGVLKYMESKNMEIDLDKVNRLVSKFAREIVNLYIAFS